MQPRNGCGKNSRVDFVKKDDHSTPSYLVVPDSLTTASVNALLVIQWRHRRLCSPYNLGQSCYPKTHPRWAGFDKMLQT